MLDRLGVARDQADPGEDRVGAAREVAKRSIRIHGVDGLPVDPSSEVHRRVHAERRAAAVDGARLAARVVADERDGIGVGRVVLGVLGRDDLERDPELLENRPALRRRRREDERRHGPGLRATQISSAGHFRAHSAENVV